MTVMTWKLCVTIIIKVDLPAINWANIIRARLNPDNTQCLGNISTLRTVCGFLMMVLDVMYWFCLYYNQVGFLKQEKSPRMITMLITRTLANWKGSGKYNWSWDVVIYPPVWYSLRTWNVNRPARFCLVKRFKSFLMSLSVVTDGSCFLRAQFPSIHRRFFNEITPNKALLFYALSNHDGRRRKQQQL